MGAPGGRPQSHPTAAHGRMGGCAPGAPARHSPLDRLDTRAPACVASVRVRVLLLLLLLLRAPCTALPARLQRDDLHLLHKALQGAGSDRRQQVGEGGSVGIVQLCSRALVTCTSNR